MAHIEIFVPVLYSTLLPNNQRYIVVAIEGQQPDQLLSQAQRMRELGGKGMLIADVIDGIMLEGKRGQAK